MRKILLVAEIQADATKEDVVDIYSKAVVFLRKNGEQPVRFRLINVEYCFPRTFTIMNSFDGNETYDVVANNTMEAASIALEETGWGVIYDSFDKEIPE